MRVFLHLLLVLTAAQVPDAQGVEGVLTEATRLLEARRYAEAIPRFEQADKLAGGQCGACRVGLARAYAATSQPEKAIALVREAIPLLSAPDLLAQAYSQLGLSLLETGGSRSRSEAEAALRKAVELDEDRGSLARHRLTRILFEKRSYAEAIPLARDYLRVKPDGPASNDLRVLLCQARAAGPAGPTSSEPMAEGAALTHPEKIHGPAPAAGRKARRSSGQVILESVIDEDGCVTNLKIVSGLSAEADEDVLKAVRQWVFRPATLGGEPVKTYYMLTVKYH